MRSDWPRNIAPMQEANKRRWLRAKIQKARDVLYSSEVQEYLAKYEPNALELLRCRDPRCPDFGDPDFGQGTCPSDHAIIAH